MHVHQLTHAGRSGPHVDLCGGCALARESVVQGVVTRLLFPSYLAVGMHCRMARARILSLETAVQLLT